MTLKPYCRLRVSRFLIFPACTPVPGAQRTSPISAPTSSRWRTLKAATREPGNRRHRLASPRIISAQIVRSAASSPTCSARRIRTSCAPWRLARCPAREFQVAALAKFGLEFQSLREINPKLIYRSITGCGHRPPRRSAADYDFLLQAESGLVSLTGEPEGAPTKVGVPVVDLFTGRNATIAILAALAAPAKTGRGQRIDMALSDSSVSMLANIASSVLIYGEDPKRYGNGHATVTPYQTFSASDGQFVRCVGDDRQFRILCERVLAEPQFASDQRFLTNSTRLQNRDALIQKPEDIYSRETRASWLAKLSVSGIAAGELATVPEALNSPAVVERGMIKGVEHSTLGNIRLVGSPLKLTETPPPAWGAHQRDHQ